jgi:O-antigen ligase
MSLQDRLVERGPVEVRLALYKAGWQMFLERPLSGWGANRMAPELANRVTQYQLNASPVHNTYLEILVEHGIIGLALYLWLIIGLFRLGRARLIPENPTTVYFPDTDFPDDAFRKIWPILLGVYLMNASFVVMNYQFVNGLLFTLAGMLAAQNRRAFEFQEDVLAS